MSLSYGLKCLAFVETIAGKQTDHLSAFLQMTHEDLEQGN